MIFTRFISLLLMFIIPVIFVGCAQKVRIKALSPAEVGEMAMKKRLAITAFRNDTIGLSSKIEAKIASHKLDNQKYFNVLSRRDINKVISEHKLQSSTLMNVKTLSRVGEMLGAQAIINGEVAIADAKTDSYVISNKVCGKWDKEGKCISYKAIHFTCNTVKAQVSTSLNIVDIETGSIIYGNTLSRDYSGDSCFGNQYLSRAQVLEKLSNSIANEFVYKLTPHYVHFNVTLLDSIEIDASSLDEKRLDAALTYIQRGRYAKAEKILVMLMESLQGRSYVVAYNLGVAKEAQGKFYEAKKFYTIADGLTLEPNEEIDTAMLRIVNLIDEQEEAKKQLNAM